MPRRARVHCAGGVFHIVSRFARDEWWLDLEGARAAYLKQIERAAATSDTQVLAYCLMSNHVHLVLLQGERPLSRFLKSLHTGFARWVQRSARWQKAMGPVFAGRPREVLVDREEYLVELVRYVHNNPVRAGLARAARLSDWSSHRAYLGKVRAPEWLRMGFVLERFGATAQAAIDFEEFVNAGRQQERRPELSGATDPSEAAAARRAVGNGHLVSDGVLGSERFVERVRSDAKRVAASLSKREAWRREGALGRPTVSEVVGAVLALHKLDVLELEERPSAQAVVRAKRLATWVWLHEYEGQQIELARALGVNTSSVSRYYAQALAVAAELDEKGAAVVALLRQRKRRRARTGTKRADALPVRYHVDVDEA